MNDLLPPPRRSIPEQRRKRMRDRLDAKISSTRVNRRDGAARRYGIPAVVAAAVAALAIGGYLVANNDGGDGDDGIDPAGQGGGSSGRDDQQPEQDAPKPKPTEGQQPAPSTVLTDPDQAYQKCVDHAVRQYELRGEPITEPLTGRLAIDNGVGTTVVVANSTDSYTCNVKPDLAVSQPSKLDGTADAKDYWFAMNVHKGGEMAWAGGQVPDGATGVTYAFPDGHTEEAIVHDGFWAMQYYSDKAIATGLDWAVEVSVDGPNGQTYSLDYTAQCNQVSHGC
jgi:hypothetical protein